MSGEFDLFIGIDYSGARTPTARLKELQVYAAKPGGQPEKQFSLSAMRGHDRGLPFRAKGSPGDHHPLTP